MFEFLINTLRLIKLAAICVYFGIPYRFLKLAFVKHFSTSKPSKINAERRLSQAIVRALQYSGPSFIKLGQILSTRPDLTGDIFSEELSKLQDRLPPFSFKEVKKSIETELQGTLKQNFKDISPAPIAAASIAQVHKAVTLEGDMVAIKVLRPNIERKFAKDLKLFSFITDIISVFFRSTSRLKPQEVIKTLADTIKFELDLRFEGASADTIRENCKEDSNIRIPKIYWQYTGKRVLTMEWVDGIAIHDRDKLIEAGHDLHEIAKRLAVTFFNQAYRDGFFHADLHPGNIFVDADGNIALVDFGIIGILDHSDRLYIAEILYGFITRDYQRVSDIHFSAGYVPLTQDRILFALALRSIGEPIVGLPVHRISIGRLLKQLFEVSKTFEMETQTQLLLLQKTMVTIEGVGMSIYPEVNMWKLAEPWIKVWAGDNFGIKGKFKNFSEKIKLTAKELPHAFMRIDNIIARMETALADNKLKVDTETYNIPANTKSTPLRFIAFGIGVGAIAALFILRWVL